MKKELQRKTNYKPNDKVTITVINKPVFNEETGEKLGYAVAVTIKQRLGIQDDELTFATEDDIAKYLENIDVSDPQTNLFEGQPTPEG